MDNGAAKPSACKGWDPIVVQEGHPAHNGASGRLRKGSDCGYRERKWQSNDTDGVSSILPPPVWCFPRIPSYNGGVCMTPTEVQ